MEKEWFDLLVLVIYYIVMFEMLSCILRFFYKFKNSVYKDLEDGKKEDDLDY